MKHSNFHIDEFQNRINNQYKVYKTVLYTTVILITLVVIYILLQLTNVL